MGAQRKLKSKDNHHDLDLAYRDMGRDAARETEALIWAEAVATPQLTDAQRRELERRVADDEANPDDVVPWEQVKLQILSGLK